MSEAAVSADAKAAFPGEAWVERWVKAINADPEIRRLGKWFDAKVMFDFGGERYILKFVEGQVASVIAHPIWDKAWEFGIKASVDCWQKSLMDPPPPFHQDIFGMMWNHGMTLEGDAVKAMQHIRVVKLVLAIMKRVK